MSAPTSCVSFFHPFPRLKVCFLDPTHTPRTEGMIWGRQRQREQRAAQGRVARAPVPCARASRAAET